MLPVNTLNILTGFQQRVYALSRALVSSLQAFPVHDRFTFMTMKEQNHITETVDFLCQRFPSAFSHARSGIRPLKPNILDDVVSSLGSEAFRQPVKRALAFYQTRIHYLKKVTSGKWYRDLSGNRISIIPQEDKEHAQKKLDSILQQVGSSRKLD